MKELLTQHLSELITGLIAVVIGWISKSRMSKKVENADLTKQIQDIYKDLIADTDRKIDQNVAEIDQLKKKLEEKDEYWQEELKKVEQKWVKKYETLKRENTALKKRIAELEKFEKHGNNSST